MMLFHKLFRSGKRNNCKPKYITILNICYLLFKQVLHMWILSKSKHAKGSRTKASLVIQGCNWNWSCSQTWKTMHLFIRHSRKPVKFAEISNTHIIFIDNYSRKRTIETKFKAIKINDLDLLMTMIHTFTGVTVEVFLSHTFLQRNMLFCWYQKPIMSLSNLRFCFFYNSAE